MRTGEGVDGPDQLLVMGRVVGAYATRGWVRIQTFTEHVDGLLEYHRWWIGRGGEWREIEVEEGSVHGQNLVAKLSGIASREQAAVLCGMDIALPRSALPKQSEGEYYWADLKDLAVYNVRGERLGRVDSLLETGSNPVLVVTGDRERLIPFVDAVVQSVDLGQRRIVVDWESDY